MNNLNLPTRRRIGETALLAAIAALAAPASTAGAQSAGGTVETVLSEKLPNLSGKSLTAVLVSYGPGGKSPRHHHAGSVFAYVLSGRIRSQVSGQAAARVYKAGEAFFEPPGSEHLVSENASATAPASLLAVLVADTGAQLTVFDR